MRQKLFTRLDDQDPDATNDNEDMKNFFGRWETEDNKVESSCYWHVGHVTDPGHVRHD